MVVICHKISVKCRWNHGETFTTKIYKLGPKCRWNILIVGDNTTAKIICSLHANFFRPGQVTLLAYLSEPYFTSPKSASFFSIALLCLSPTSWYFIPSCLITALPFTKTESFSVTPSSLHAVQNMSLSVYFSHSRSCIQLNWNDLSRVSSYFFLQSTVFVSSFIFRFYQVWHLCDISERFWIFKLNF